MKGFIICTPLLNIVMEIKSGRMKCTCSTHDKNEKNYIKFWSDEI